MKKDLRCSLGKSSNELVVVVNKAQLAIAVSFILKRKFLKVACLCVGMVLCKWRVSVGLHFFSLH